MNEKHAKQLTSEELDPESVALRAAAHVGMEATIAALQESEAKETAAVVTVVVSTREADTIMSTDSGDLVPRILQRILMGLPEEGLPALILPPANNIQKAH